MPSVFNTLALFGLAIVCAIVAAIAASLVLRRQSQGEHAGFGGSDPESLLRDVQAELKAEREGRAQAEQQRAAAVEARSLLDEAILELRQRLEALETKRGEEAAAAAALLETTRAELATAKSGLAVAKEAVEFEKQKSAENLKLLADAKDAMTKEFQLLANHAMAKHGEDFKKTNQEQMEIILKPLRERLLEFQKGLQDAHTETAKERAALGEQIKSLSDTSAKMTSETLNLTRALKGTAKMQGAWGEMLLASLLEQSGLREGEEYVTQLSHTTEDGERLRPDVIVNLPGGQHVIIDSKVSLAAFEAHVNAESDEERVERLDAHLGSLRAHIKRLSAKEYHAASPGGLDYVVMFIPIEGALAVALQKDPALTNFAVQNNVAIATPTTLMIALRTIDNVWRVERRNRNAEVIAERAGKLYDKFVGFIDDMKGLGNRLTQAQTTYNNAMAKLQSGSGNLVGQVEKLKRLGARTSKSLPGEMTDDHEDADTLSIASETPGLIVGSLEPGEGQNPLGNAIEQ